MQQILQFQKFAKIIKKHVSLTWVDPFHACQLENKYQKDTYFIKGLFAFNK